VTPIQALVAVLRSEGVDRVFGNPGTTELPLTDALVDEPDLPYVLGLQEASVVAMADGYARATRRPAFVSPHVAAGLANGLIGLLNARRSRTPLVVTAGQQDRRHLVQDPMLSGDLVGLAIPATVSLVGGLRPTLAAQLRRTPGAPSRARALARTSVRMRAAVDAAALDAYGDAPLDPLAAVHAIAHALPPDAVVVVVVVEEGITAGLLLRRVLRQDRRPGRTCTPSAAASAGASARPSAPRWAFPTGRWSPSSATDARRSAYRACGAPRTTAPRCCSS